MSTSHVQARKADRANAGPRWSVRAALVGWLLMALVGWSILLIPGYYAVHFGGNAVVAMWESLQGHDRQLATPAKEGDPGPEALPEIAPAAGAQTTTDEQSTKE